MKYLLLCISSCLLFSNFFSQALPGKKRRLEVYFGGNNEDVSYRYSLDKYAKDASFITTGGLNFIGVHFDFITQKNLQFGIDYMHNRVWANYFLPDQTSGSDGNPYDFSMAVEERFYRHRLMARMNYTLPVSTEKLQVYVSGAVGYLHSRVNINLSDKTLPKPEKQLYNGSFMFSSPITFKFNAGMRYYFNPKIGMLMEFGFGGALANVGLTTRF